MMQTVNLFYAILALSLVTEAVITTIKWAFKGQLNPWRILAIMLAVGLALVYRVDLLAVVGVKPAWASMWWVGAVLTGLVMSRGANVVADLAKNLELAHSGKTSTTPAPHDVDDDAEVGSGMVM